MQIKHLFVSLLAFGSAVATANPAVNQDGVEARDDAGHVEPRGTSCPSTMYYDKSKGKCTCSEGYFWDYSVCKSICGSDGSAYYSSKGKNCICKNSAFKFNSSTRKCDCGQGKTWDSYGKKCVTSCGGGASLVKGKCTCPSASQKYDSYSKKCSAICKAGTKFQNGKCVSVCSPGTKWNGSKCVSVCSSGTKYENGKCVSICSAGTKYDGKKCVSVCKAGTKWDSYSKKCVSSCKAGTKWDSYGNKCVSVCKDGQKYENGKCVAICSAGTKYDGKKCVSVCKAGQKWDSYGSKCVSACQAGTKWDSSKNKCVTVCKDGQKWDSYGNKCVNACEPGTSWDSAARKCTSICKDGSSYKNGDCICKPGFEYSNDKCISICKDGASWTDGRCQCKEGYDYTNSKCVLNCGKYADLEGSECVCKDTGKVYDTEKKTCSCSEDTEYNREAGKCVEKCGPDASYNVRKGECKCDTPSMVWDKGVCACASDKVLKKGECVPDCGSTAYWNGWKEECVCEKDGQEFKDKETGCGCFGENEVYDEDRRRCVPDCGESATYSSREKGCVCNNSKLDYDTDSKTCGCKEGYKLEGKLCVPICPRHSEYVKADGETLETCHCTKNGFEYNKETNSCDNKCPRDADFENEKCVCHNSNYEVIEGKCQCPSGTVPQGRGSCKPACKDGAEWYHKANACVCKKPNTEYKEDACVCEDGFTADADGVCQSKCPKSAYWKDGQCNCRNSQYEFVQSEDEGKGRCRCPDGKVPYGPNGKFCRKDCGDAADFKNDKCECKLRNADYDDESKTCDCKDGYSKNNQGECRPICPHNADYVPAAGGKEATCDCRGEALEYVQNLNACKPKCPDDAEFVKGSGQIEDTCKCKSDSDKYEDKKCSPKCPSDADYVPKVGETDETCSCKNDKKQYDSTSRKCVSKCPRGQYPVKDEGADTFTCQCRDESKKAVGDQCEAKCPSDSKYVPKDGQTDWTCKCDNKHLEYSGGICQCPSETEPRGEYCIPKCPSESSYQHGKGCVCDDTNASLTDGETKTCECKTGYEKNEESGKCESICPKESKYVPKNGNTAATCKCDNEHFVYENKVCGCPKNTEQYGSWCKPICAKGASLDKSKKPWTCKCDVKDSVVVGGEGADGECKCPPEKPRTFLNKCVACPEGSSVSSDGKSCVCAVGKFNWLKNKCLCDNGKEPKDETCPTDCGREAHEVNQACQCYVKNAIFKDKTCTCPTGAKKVPVTQVRRHSNNNPPSYECVCDQTKLKGSVFNTAKDACVCPDDKVQLGDLCVPDCKNNFVLNDNKDACICPETHHPEGEDKCTPLCVVTPKPTKLKRTVPDEDCYCDTTKYDLITVGESEKCVNTCDPGYIHKKDDPEGECVCNLETHGVNDDGNCVEICPEHEYTSYPPLSRRTPVAACYCNPETHKSYENGAVCVPKCEHGEDHNPDDSYKCWCNDETHGEVEGECVENCPLDPVIGGDRKRTSNNDPCFCAEEYIKFDGGLCFTPCLIENEERTEANNYQCTCDDTTHKKVDEETCSPRCTDGETITTNKCFCNEETHFDDNGTCKPLCKDGDDVEDKDCYCDEETQHHDTDGTCKPRCDILDDVEAKKCFCPEGDTSEWDVAGEGKCVKKCTPPLTHNLQDRELKCHCDPTKNHVGPNDKCTPFCAAGDKLKTGTPDECYCKEGPGSNLVAKNEYCVEKCTRKNEELSNASPPVCECPSDKHQIPGGACVPYCQNGDKFQNGNEACYCDPNKNLEEHKDFCRTPCGDNATREPNGQCKCKTDAFQPNNSPFSGCQCPSGASLKGNACVCVNYNNQPDNTKEIVKVPGRDPECKTKCLHKSSRNNQGECVCSGANTIYNSALGKCVCSPSAPPNHVFRDGSCKSPCPSMTGGPQNGPTRSDSAGETCICRSCIGNYCWDSTSLKWDPNGNGGNGKCVSNH